MTKKKSWLKATFTKENLKIYIRYDIIIIIYIFYIGQLDKLPFLLILGAKRKISFL